MRTYRKLLFLVATLPALLSSGIALAAAPATITITVDGMHCPVCAKKITGRVMAVSGVAGAKADVKAAQITVTAKTPNGPSSRALWESVEKAGYTPTKLAGPGGTFTEKPKS